MAAGDPRDEVWPDAAGQLDADASVSRVVEILNGDANVVERTIPDMSRSPKDRFWMVQAGVYGELYGGFAVRGKTLLRG